jgi:hypothetical protein
MVKFLTPIKGHDAARLQRPTSGFKLQASKLHGRFRIHIFAKTDIFRAQSSLNYGWISSRYVLLFVLKSIGIKRIYS